MNERVNVLFHNQNLKLWQYHKIISSKSLLAVPVLEKRLRNFFCILVKIDTGCRLIQSLITADWDDFLLKSFIEPFPPFTLHPDFNLC